MSGLIRPKIELDRTFMPVLVTSNFDDDSIKNEWASMETPFSHYKYGKFFRRSRAANYVVSGPIWPKFELVRDFMHVLITCKYKKDWIKNNREKVATSFFPIISQWGLSVAMETRVLIQSVPKTLSSLSPTPVMLHIKFDQDWPTGFRDIQVWKCGRRRDDRPLVYYKLTLWAFGSGELKNKRCFVKLYPNATVFQKFNPHLPCGFIHPDQFDGSISNLRGVWCTCSFLFYFFIQIHCRPWSEAAFCDIWSGSILFAYVPFMRR